MEEVRWISGGGVGGVDGVFGSDVILGDWRSYVGTSILNTWNWNSEPNDGFLQRIVDIREIE